jgi:hypothetical protein
MNAARRVILFLVLAVLLQGGCDSGIRYEHAKVHGKVTYQGRPVTFGSVMFIPVNPPKEGLMQPASGSINPDGTYELASQSTSGAILGEHTVLVIAVDGGKSAEPRSSSKEGDKPPMPANGSKTVQFKSAIPKKYSDPSTTTLKRKVTPGDNTIDIDLTD